jgi:hypothetical protein
MEKNINVIIGEKYKQEEPAKTAYNKQYALRALFAPSGFEKPQSPTALCGFLSPTFQPTANLRFAL